MVIRWQARIEGGKLINEGKKQLVESQQPGTSAIILNFLLSSRQ